MVLLQGSFWRGGVHMAEREAESDRKEQHSKTSASDQNSCCGDETLLSSQEGERARERETEGERERERERENVWLRSYGESSARLLVQVDLGDNPSCILFYIKNAATVG